MALNKKKCVPCENGTPPMESEEINRLLSELESGWHAVNDKELIKSFEFSDFKGAMVFANQIAAVAEQENHHPDLGVGYGKLEVTLSTHSIGGLSENDFILASKIDSI